MFDGKAFGQEVVAAVKAHVDKAITPLLERIAELERTLASQPTPKDGADGAPGRDGAAGKDADPEIIRQMVADAVTAMPRPENGKDADPAVIARMVADEVAKLPPAKDGVSVDPADVQRMVDSAVAALPPAQPGKDADPALVADLVKAEAERILAGWERPQDGKSVTAEELHPLIDECVQRVAAAIPVPKDGKNGTDGKDGAPGTAGKDGRDGLDAVEFLRAADGHLVVTLSNGTTRDLGEFVGKDGRDGERGADGAPGRDGFGFDDLDVIETDKGFVMRFAQGEAVKEFRLPIVVDRGVWKEGAYAKGDGVTWGGSFWIAQDETTEKPDSGKGWRLAVKKGRDGKDGFVKDMKPAGPVKVG